MVVYRYFVVKKYYVTGRSDDGASTSHQDHSVEETPRTEERNRVQQQQRRELVEVHRTVQREEVMSQQRHQQREEVYSHYREDQKSQWRDDKYQKMKEEQAQEMKKDQKKEVEKWRRQQHAQLLRVPKLINHYEQGLFSFAELGRPLFGYDPVLHSELNLEMNLLKHVFSPSTPSVSGCNYAASSSSSSEEEEEETLAEREAKFDRIRKLGVEVEAMLVEREKNKPEKKKKSLLKRFWNLVKPGKSTSRTTKRNHDEPEGSQKTAERKMNEAGIAAEPEADTDYHDPTLSCLDRHAEVLVATQQATKKYVEKDIEGMVEATAGTGRMYDGTTPGTAASSSTATVTAASTTTGNTANSAENKDDALPRIENVQRDQHVHFSFPDNEPQTIINVVNGNIGNIRTPGGIIVLDNNGTINAVDVQSRTNCVYVEEPPATLTTRVHEQELRWSYLRHLRNCEKETQPVIQFSVLGLENLDATHAMRVAYQAVLTHLELTPDTKLLRVTFVAPTEKMKITFAGVMGQHDGIISIRSPVEAGSIRNLLETTVSPRNRAVVEITSETKVGSWIPTWGATKQEQQKNVRETRQIAGITTEAELQKQRRVESGPELRYKETARKRAARRSSSVRIDEERQPNKRRRTIDGEDHIYELTQNEQLAGPSPLNIEKNNAYAVSTPIGSQCPPLSLSGISPIKGTCNSRRRTRNTELNGSNEDMRMSCFDLNDNFLSDEFMAGSYLDNASTIRLGPPLATSTQKNRITNSNEGVMGARQSGGVFTVNTRAVGEIRAAERSSLTGLISSSQEPLINSSSLISSIETNHHQPESSLGRLVNITKSGIDPAPQNRSIRARNIIDVQQNGSTPTSSRSGFRRDLQTSNHPRWAWKDALEKEKNQISGSRAPNSRSRVVIRERGQYDDRNIGDVDYNIKFAREMLKTNMDTGNTLLNRYLNLDFDLDRGQKLKDVAYLELNRRLYEIDASLTALTMPIFIQEAREKDESERKKELNQYIDQLIIDALQDYLVTGDPHTLELNWYTRERDRIDPDNTQGRNIGIYLEIMRKRENIDVLRRLVVDTIGEVKNSIKRQLEADLLGDSEGAELSLRRLGRVPYHVWRFPEPVDSYTSMDVLYPVLHRKFTKNDNSVSEEANENMPINVETMNTLERDAIIDSPAASDDENGVIDPIRAEEEVLQEMPAVEISNFRNAEGNVNAIDQAVVEELAGDEAANIGDEVARAILRNTIFIKECSEECPKCDPAEAHLIVEKLLRFVNAVGLEPTRQFDQFNTIYLQPSTDLLEECEDGTFKELSMKQWLLKHMPCYQGMRSISNRLNEAFKLISSVKKIYEATNANICDMEALHDVLSLDDLPQRLKFQFYARTGYVEQLLHREAEVRARYGDQIDKLRKKIEDTETSICTVCLQIVRESLVKERPNKSLTYKHVEKIRKDGHSPVCVNCWNSIRAAPAETPMAAFINGLQYKEIPEVLKNFNWVELMLIQRVRAIHSIITMRDISGRRTLLKGTKGCMVMVPVNVEGTINHLARTLPDSSNMMIEVQTPAGLPKLVDLPKVLRALRWLKAHNDLYKDIEINENFKFTNGKDVVFMKDGTEEDVDNLILRDEATSSDRLLTQTEMDVVPLVTVNPPEADAELAIRKYTMKRNANEPLLNNYPHADVLVFPNLHPEGKWGMDEKDERKREEKLHLSTYVHHRLRSKDRRWAQNIQWVTFMYQLRLQKDVTSILGVQGRIARGATAGDLHKLLQEDMRFATTMNSVYAKLRGYAPYWKQVKQDLKAHIAVFGIPTFFVTLNPNELEWKEVHQLYSKLTGKEVDKKNIREEIAKDPTPWCRYWEHRKKVIFEDFILQPKGPLGDVTHMFMRTEYQHRGTEHLHCVIWTKDRPGPDASDEEIRTFINKYITARLPDEDEEPELFELVNKHQRHRMQHTKTCIRIKKYRKKMKKTCRFEFPRPKCGKTIINRKHSVHIGLRGLKSKSYYLARKEEERYINDYNAPLLLATKANMDIQFIMADTTDIVSYICGYTTKSEKAKGQDYWELAKEMDPEKGKEIIFKKLVDLLKMRETGELEMVDMLMSHPLYRFDAKHVFINTNTSDKRDRILKPTEQLEGNDQIQAHKDNWPDTYYPHRPKCLEKFSYLNLMTNFEIVSSKGKRILTEYPEADSDEQSNGSNEEGAANDEYAINLRSGNAFRWDYNILNEESPFYCHPRLKSGDRFAVPGNDKMFFKKRRQQVPRLFFRDVVDENEEDYQDYHRRLAMLFKPWRMEDEKPADMDYDKWFEQYFDQLHPQAQQDIQKLIRNLQNLRKDDLERKQRMDLIMAARSAAGIEDQVEDALEVQERIVDVGQHEKNVDGLNGGQSNLFKMVTGRIDDQALGKEVDAIRIFCSGTAGCGKSYLIDRLADDVTIKHCKTEDSGFRPAVLIAAPTGLAAISVKGDTIHNLFGIEVQHGRDKTFRALPDRNKEQKRALFSNVKLVIIDEISMCSAITLQKIHLRLQEIRGNNEYFGGVNLCVFGDLMQLPPVMAPRVFSVLQNVRSIFHSIEANVSIWRTFDYQELTENMRQKDDLDFANMMGRCRVGALTEDDIKAFEGQIIPNTHGKEATIDEGVQHYLALMESDPTVMALFPTIAEVDQFNETVMEKKNMDTVTIHCREEIILSTAEDIRSLEKRRKNPISRIYQETRMTILKNKARKTALAKKKKREMLDREAAGLSAKLKLAVGGRVMLRRNVNRRQGLVNGATGVLRRIQWVGDNVEMLDIEFDRIPGKTISIQRDVAAYDVSLHERRRRSQFPVCMAFAATIHKCQGLTLRNALVSTKAAFEKGQLFVALSRVTNLKSLHLMDFVPSKITVDIRSLVEYNRLRKSIGLPEFAIPTSNNDVAGEEGNKKLRKSTKRKSTSAAVQIIREEPQRPIKKAARRVSVPPGIQFPGNLRLHNEANQCFANSYAQLIRRCFLEFVDNELGVDRGTVIWQELRRIITTLDDPTNNMHPFLELFVTYSDIPGMENYDDGEQHDAVELLHQSSSGPWLPACIQRAMKLDVINQTRCLTPGCTETRNEINPCHFIGILSSPIQRSFTRALEETSRREINREIRCDTCGGVGGTKEQHQFYQVNESTQFLAVEVNHFDYDRTNLGHRVSNPVEAPPNDGFKYQGARWRPIAAIWHQGGSPSSGHYKCYSRQQDGTWLIHSDDKIEPCSSLPPVLELIRYIIFERVDVVPDGLHGVAMEIDTPPSSPQRGSLSISSISSPAAVYPTNFPIVRLRNPLAPPAQFPRSVRYLQEDMFDVKADCLINAANNQLIPGEGIDGAMRRRAGQGLTAETSTYMNQRRNKAIPPGSAVLTGAHDLTSDGYKFIVHTAAPKLSSKRAKPSLQQMVEYISCLYNSFVKADEAGAESIVTAVIGSGIYNWSKELATALSLQAASLFLEINSLSTLQNITVVEKEFRTYNQNRNKCLGGKKELKVGTGTTDLLESKIETKDVQEQLQKTSEKFKKNLANQK